MPRPKLTLDHEPKVTLKYRRDRNKWHAHCYWPSTGKRQYIMLCDGTPEQTIDPTPTPHPEAQNALEAFIQNDLQTIHTQHTQTTGDHKATNLTLDQIARSTTPTNPPLQLMLDWYTTTHLPYQQRSPVTIKQFNYMVSSFITWGQEHRVHTFADITSLHLQQWQLWRSDTATRMRKDGPNHNELTRLRQFIHDTLQHFPTIQMHPLTWNIPTRKKSNKYRVIPKQELDTFLTHIHHHYPQLTNLITWLSLSGWHIGDTLALQWHHIQDTTATFTKGKNKRDVQLPITTPMRAILATEHAKHPHTPSPNTPVFTHPDLSPWTYNQYRTLLEHSTRDTGIPLNARDLRKTLSTHLQQSGVDLKTTTALLGNTTDSVTLNNYNDTNLDHMQKSLETHHTQTTENP